MTTFVVLGWLGNACFFARFFVQWIVSEKQKRSVAPVAFWWLSLAGAVFMGTYTFHRQEPVLFTGIVVNAAIYVRNLHIGSSRALTPIPLAAMALAATAILLWTGVLRAREDHASELLWLICAVAGQTMWSTRFVVQWWFTERRQMSHFPAAFWWISLLGNVLLLSYAIHLRDAVLIAGYTPGPLVQVRNLILGHGPKRDEASVETSPGR